MCGASSASYPLRRRRNRLAKAPPAGLEPATPGLEGRCSIQLSYGGPRREQTQAARRRGFGTPSSALTHARDRNRGTYLGTLDAEICKSWRHEHRWRSDEQDLTRKQRREQARAERKAMEEAEAAGAQRRKRLIQLGSGGRRRSSWSIVVILVATRRRLEIGPRTNTSTAAPTTRRCDEVDAALGGIPQNGNTLGSPTAPVTMQYFGDLECPICKQFTLGALPPLIEKYVRPGKLRIEYRNLADGHARTGNVPHPADRGARGRQAEEGAGTTSSSSTTSRAKRTRATSPRPILQGLAQQVPGLNLATGRPTAQRPKFANRSRQTRRRRTTRASPARRRS